MLTRNLCSRMGLCNGSIGTVKDIIYTENTQPPQLPLAVIVKFDDYVGPSFFTDDCHSIPIVPQLTVSSELGVSHERTQLPLKLAWAITIHKSQGLTLKKAWVDIGKSEAFDGLSYVALSRVKSLSDMIIEPFSFERLEKIKQTKGFLYRKKEEERLNNLSLC